MKAKKLCALLLSFALISSLAACGEKTNSPSSNPAPGTSSSSGQSSSDTISISSKQIISLGGGVSGGTFAMLGAGMATVITSNVENLSVNCEGTSGSVEACKLVGSGDLAFALSASDAFYTATVGTGSFEGAALDNLRIAMGGYNAPFHIIVRADSDIYSMQDLKGKRITASAGNTIQNQLPFIMEAYGYGSDDYTAVPLSQSEGADALKDGNVDCIIQTTGIGTSAYMDLTTSIDCRFLSMDQDKVDAIHEKLPYVVQEVIPAGSYKGQDEEMLSCTTTNFLICGAEVPDEVVYAVVKALHTHNSEFSDIHYLGAEFTPEFTVANQVIELHPGAVQYYKELGLM